VLLLRGSYRTPIGCQAGSKSANTISHVEHIVRAYLVPRFGNEIAEDIKPLDIQSRTGRGLDFTTCVTA